MTLTVTHTFVSTVADSSNTEWVKPATAWNAAHNVAGTLTTASITGNWPVAQLDSGTGASATTFWRGDGVWGTPVGSSGVPQSPGGSNLQIQYNNAGAFGGLSDVQVTARIQSFGALSGATPASSGGTTNFLRADGTWNTPPGTGVGDADKGDITVAASVWTIDAGVVTYAKMQNIATDSLIGRDTAAAGSPEQISVSGGIEFTGSGGIQTGALSGDVTKAAGGTVLTIPNDTVTYAKMQNVTSSGRFLGRISAGAGDVEELTGTQATTLLDSFSGSIKALVPVSSGGTTNFLRADGSWQIPVGLRNLTTDTTFYVRTAPATVTISIASPGIVSWASHGLSVGDQVVFSSPLDRGTCTISVATPAVVTKVAHGYVANDPISFTTSGVLPTGVTAGTTYFVLAAGLSADTFRFSGTLAGPAVDTTLAGSGVHYVQRVNTLPNEVQDGGLFYVILAGYTANSFEFSTSAGGAAVNTTGSTAGRIVAQTGNNTNDGTAADRAHAFLSLWGAMTSVFTTYNLNNYTITFQMADGTYAGSHTIGCKINICDNFNSGSDIRPPTGNGRISISGNSSNPDAVKGSGSGNLLSFRTFRSVLSYVYVTGMRLTSDFSDTITSNGISIVVTNVNYGGGAAFWAALGAGTYIYSANSGAMYQVLADPGDGALFVAAHGGTISLQFGDTVRAIGTRSMSHALIDLKDDEEGLPASFDNQGVTFDGVWAGTLYRTAWGSQCISFTSSAFNAEYPATLTPGVVSPFGRWYESLSGTTIMTRYGADGSPVDAYYNYQSSASYPTGFVVTAQPYDGHVIIDSTNAISSGTFILGSSPIDGQMINVRAGKAITTLSVIGSCGGGATVIGAPSSMNAGSQFSAIFRSTNSTWYCGR